MLYIKFSKIIPDPFMELIQISLFFYNDFPTK